MLKSKNIKSIIFCIMIIIQPIIAQITALMVRSGNAQITLGMLFNGVILLFGLIYTFFLNKSKYKKKSIIYLILMCMFCLLFYIFKYNQFNLNYFIREAVFMFKYLYFPIIIIFLINFLDSENIEIKGIENSVKIAMIVYCLLIIIAELTGTSNLSYQNSYSGKMGWFYSSNELGATLVILLPYMFLNFKENKKLNLLFIILSIITVLFIGTKTSFLGVILLLLVLVGYFFIKTDLRKKIILILGIIIASISILLINPPALQNMKQSFNYYLDFADAEDVNQVPRNANLSFLIFSERTIFFENAYNSYKESKLIDKFFGIGFTNNDPNTNYQNHLIEMDFFDILFKYGIVGLIIYICPIVYILYSIIKYHFKKKLKVDFSDIIYMYIVFLAIIISFLAGHILGSPSVSIFLALSLAIIFCRTNRRLIK